MKRKLRIFSHIAIICLSVCMFAFGVYAASTVSVTTSGTVTFQATGVYATVSRRVFGAVGGTIQNAAQEVNASTTQPVKFGENEELTFQNATTPIKMVFTITNLAEDRNIDFSITENNTENTNVTATYESDANEYKSGVYNINPLIKVESTTISDNVATVTILFTVTDPNVSAKLKYNYSISLSEQQQLTNNLTISGNGTTYEKIGNTYVTKSAFSKTKEEQLMLTKTGAENFYDDKPYFSSDEAAVYTVYHVFGNGSSTINSNVENKASYWYFSTGDIMLEDTNVSGDIIVPQAVYDDEGWGFIPSGAQIVECNNITSVEYPSGVQIYQLPYNCANLTTLKVSRYYNPANTMIDSSFSGNNCPKLASIIVESGNTYLDTRENWNALIKKDTKELIYGCKNTIFPNDLKKIGQCAFASSGITTIDLSNKSELREIGDNAFYDSPITSINLSNCINLTIIGGNALNCYDAVNGNSTLTSVNFENCVKLDFEEGLWQSTVEDGILSANLKNCKSLTNEGFAIIADMNGLNELNLSGCSSLTNISINCMNNTTVIIPISITEIGCNYAYLSEIKYEGTEEQWNKINVSENLNLENVTMTYNYRES